MAVALASGESIEVSWYPAPARGINMGMASEFILFSARRYSMASVLLGIETLCQNSSEKFE